MRQSYQQSQIFFLLVSFVLIIISIFTDGYPLYSFMTSPVGSLDDLRNPLVYAPEIFESNIGVGFTPIQVIIYEFLRKFDIYFVFVITSFLSLLFLLYSSNKYNLKNTVKYSVFLLYPTIFCLSRGNNDIWLIGFIFLFCYYAIKKKQILSAINLGIITSIDPVFTIYSILFFSKKSLRFWSVFISLNLVLYIIPIIVYKANPISELINIVGQYLLYNRGMVSGDGGLLFGNSFIGLIKIVTIFLFSSNTILLQLGLIQILPALACILLIAYFSHFIDISKETVKYLYLILTCTMILFLSAAPDYKLIFIYPALLLIIEQNRKEDFFLFILINIILMPKYFFWFTFDYNPTGFTFNSIINPVLLILVTIISFKKLTMLESVKNESHI
jgi:hypothetical protein